MLRATQAREVCLLLVAIALCSSGALAEQGLKPLTVNGGQVVYDENNKVYWLADANFAASEEGKKIQRAKGVDGINPNGSMSFATAQNWVFALNKYGYLNHHDWQLPTTPLEDASCGTRGPGGASFGGLCQGDNLGNLYYVGLQDAFPADAAPSPGVNVRPLENVQFSYYWTQASGGVTGDGKKVFSFSTGDSDVTEVNDVYYFTLPMLPKQDGPIGGAAPKCAGGEHLALYTEGPAANQAVYDCETGISWPANANLATKQNFGVTGDVPQGLRYRRPYPSKHPITLPVPEIDDGAMMWKTAQDWVYAMNHQNSGYLTGKYWQLPDSPADLKTLFEHLGLSAGDARFVSTQKVGPFENLQPFFYWEVCEPTPGAAKGDAACDKGNAPAGKAGGQMDFDFSFGYGLLSTDLSALNYFVMVYYPAEAKPPQPAPSPPPHKPPVCPPGVKCPKPI
jgi:hypothetical protein